MNSVAPVKKKAKSERGTITAFFNEKKKKPEVVEVKPPKRSKKLPSTNNEQNLVSTVQVEKASLILFDEVWWIWIFFFFTFFSSSYRSDRNIDEWWNFSVLFEETVRNSEKTNYSHIKLSNKSWRSVNKFRKDRIFSNDRITTQWTCKLTEIFTVRCFSVCFVLKGIDSMLSSINFISGNVRSFVSFTIRIIDSIVFKWSSSLFINSSISQSIFFKHVCLVRFVMSKKIQVNFFCLKFTTHFSMQISLNNGSTNDLQRSIRWFD